MSHETIHWQVAIEWMRDLEFVHRSPQTTIVGALAEAVQAFATKYARDIRTVRAVRITPIGERA